MIVTKDDAWIAAIGFAMRIFETEDMNKVMKAIKTEAEIMRANGWGK